MTIEQYLNNLSAISGVVFSTMGRIFTLYSTDFILGGVLGLWFIKRIARLFDRL